MEIEITICNGGGINPPAFLVTRGAFPVKALLKANGFRWDPANKVWYAEPFSPGVRPAAEVYDAKHAFKRNGILAEFVNAKPFESAWDEPGRAKAFEVAGCHRKVAKDDRVYRAAKARWESEGA